MVHYLPCLRIISTKDIPLVFLHMKLLPKTECLISGTVRHNLEPNAIGWNDDYSVQWDAQNTTMPNITPKLLSELKKTWTNTSVDRAEGLIFYNCRDYDQTLGKETAEQDRED